MRAEKSPRLARVLAARGVRMTAQRRILLGLIEQAGRPLDARSLLALGRKQSLTLEKTTVYRTINLLKQHELVDELDLLHREGTGHYYEPVPARQEFHLVCLGCDRMIEMSSRCWDRMKEEVEEERGFLVSTARVEIGGRCRRCRGQKTEDRGQG